MAAANESQGLKIAVAIFVSLTVILSVATYFVYSEYSKSEEKLADATQKASQNQQAASKALADFQTVRDRSGYQTLNDAQQVVEGIRKDQEGLIEKLADMEQAVSAAISRVRDAGAPAEEVNQFQTDLQRITQRFQEETQLDSATLKSSLETLTELISNTNQLATSLAANNVRLRRDLESINQVNKTELDVQVTAAQKAADDLQDQINQYEQMRLDMVLQIDDLQSEYNQLIAERDRLTGTLARERDDTKTQRELLSAQLITLRERAERQEMVLDVADGHITYVDYTQKEVRTNLTRGMGARPQMIFAVFDRDAPGLPTDKPKARIQLVQVNEGDSIAKIVHTFDMRNPLHAGDQVYSAAWSPMEPVRFALVGKIDMNRDGRDDREDLKRLIRAAGGVIDFDLPPPALGSEQGEITAYTSWYVIDDRDPIRTPANQSALAEMETLDQEFVQRRTEVFQIARENGVRPMPLERLLPSLGYSFGMMIPGVVEAANTRAIEALINPEGMTAPLPGSEDFDAQRFDDFTNQPDGGP